MKALTSATPLRCAIYTRKSTEHNLDLAFNSLDAQREACEAYVKSQAHEGWRLLAGRYDDGGLSGASLERPALQRLLAEIRARQVDVVVVYKVDRLTRSLADFAKLVEQFDAHEVAFVSVTQSFNTTSSMGRLTLNVLLSFAQFEREVIGERVRDKIAASKRKGLWVGGPVPLGYRSVNKTLVVVPEQAEIVRTVFSRYLAVGSIRRLSEDLAQRGITPCGRGTAEDRSAAARRRASRFMVGPLGHMLRNRFYIGEVVYKGEAHPGQHEPIVGREMFEAVQQHLRAGAVKRRWQAGNTAFLLRGLLYDERGHRMTPSHTNKRGVRYRYYVSQAVLQGHTQEAGAIRRVAAPDIEAKVVTAVRERFSHDPASPPDRLDEGSRQSGGAVAEDREVIAAHVTRVSIGAGKITIVVRNPEGEGRQPSSRPLVIAWQPTPVRMHKAIIQLAPDRRQLDAHGSEVLLTTIGRARLWVREILENRVTSFAEIAEREGKVERHIRLLAPLAFVSPRIIDAVIAGTAPAGLTVTGLARALPLSWAEQERAFVIG